MVSSIHFPTLEIRQYKTKEIKALRKLTALFSPDAEPPLRRKIRLKETKKNGHTNSGRGN